LMRPDDHARERSPQEEMQDLKRKIMRATVNDAKHTTCPYETDELEALFANTPPDQPRQAEEMLPLSCVDETIEIGLPSDVYYVKEVIAYLVERAAKFGIVRPEDFNLCIALDEALTNAIKHGNRDDASKTVRIRAEFSTCEARFTIIDEGAGFNLAAIPDPRDPANLFKPSGRGLLLIRHIMDEVRYYERGNVVTMIKRPE